MSHQIFKGRVLGWMIVLLFLGGAVRAQTWEGVKRSLGRPGIPDGKGVRFEFPRTDLNVLVQGIPLEPRALLVSEASFTPKGRAASMSARVLVLENEVPKVKAQAVRHGLQLLAEDIPFPAASLAIHRIFLTGQGPRRKLAWALKMALGSTGTPITSETQQPIFRPALKKDPWANVRNTLGPGQEAGRSLVYEWGGDKPLRIVFQKEGKDLMIWGEIRSASSDLDLWAPKIQAKGFQVLVLTRVPNAPEQGWLDFWCLNDEKKAINNLMTLFKGSEFAVSTPGP